MIGLVAGLLLACQDPVPKVVPGDITASRWPLSGPAEMEDGADVSVRGRRMVRRWDPNLKMFAESQADSGMLRMTVPAAGKRFEGTVRGATAARYTVGVSDEKKVLYSDIVALGPVEPLFSRGPAEIKIFLELRDKAVEFLDEIEKVIAHQLDNSPKRRDDYLKRVAVCAETVQELATRTDFTGTAEVLRVVYFHIRNVQIWEQKGPAPSESNDPIRQKKKLFMDLDLTIEALRKTLDSIPAILSSEVKVSTCLILERLLAQAGENERRREMTRAAARAASKLAEAAPIPDKELVGVLDQAADRSTDPAEIRTLLHKTGIALVVP